MFGFLGTTAVRILVVEDEPLIAMELEAWVREFGYVCVGPLRNRLTAVEAAESEEIHAAIVDMILCGETADPVLEILAARGVPFALATGMPEGGINKRWANRPRLQKPFGRDEAWALLRVMITDPQGCQS